MTIFFSLHNQIQRTHPATHHHTAPRHTQRKKNNNRARQNARTRALHTAQLFCQPCFYKQVKKTLLYHITRVEFIYRFDAVERPPPHPPPPRVLGEGMKKKKKKLHQCVKPLLDVSLGGAPGKKKERWRRGRGEAGGRLYRINVTHSQHHITSLSLRFLARVSLMLSSTLATIDWKRSSRCLSSRHF